MTRKLLLVPAAAVLALAVSFMLPTQPNVHAAESMSFTEAITPIFDHPSIFNNPCAPGQDLYVRYYSNARKTNLVGVHFYFICSPGPDYSWGVTSIYATYECYSCGTP